MNFTSCCASWCTPPLPTGCSLSASQPWDPRREHALRMISHACMHCMHETPRLSLRNGAPPCRVCQHFACVVAFTPHVCQQPWGGLHWPETCTRALVAPSTIAARTRCNVACALVDLHAPRCDGIACESSGHTQQECVHACMDTCRSHGVGDVDTAHALQEPSAMPLRVLV